MVNDVPNFDDLPEFCYSFLYVMMLLRQHFKDMLKEFANKRPTIPLLSIDFTLYLTNLLNSWYLPYL